MKRIYLILLPLAAILCTSCGNNEQQDANVIFNTYTDNMFRNDLENNTLNMHYTLRYPEDYGITDYDVCMFSLNADSLRRSYDEYSLILDDLASIDYESLDASNQLTYDILTEYLSTELMASNMILFTEVLSPCIGIQAQLPVLFAEYTFNRQSDIDDYLILLSQIDTYYEDIIEFERLKSANYMFMSDTTAKEIIDGCNEFILSPEDNYLISTFNTRINNCSFLDDAAKEAYISANQDIVANDVINSYKIIIDGLTSLLGTGINDGGLCYYNNGTSYYEYLVKSSTGSSRSVDEIDNMIKKYQRDYIITISELISADVALIDEVNIYDGTVYAPENILLDLTNKYTDYFPAMPICNYDIKYVDSSLENILSPAFYLTPCIDDYKDNVIYINGSYNSNNLYTTLAHEGYPGHMYQTTYSLSTTSSLIRSLLSFPGYVEGWATYIEYYGYLMSTKSTELATILSANNYLTLSLYAAIDIGVNYKGWYTDDINDYLSTYGIDNPAISAEIFNAVVSEPANYLKYFVGYMEFNELKERYKTSYDLVSFHKIVLDTGECPFYILDRVLASEIK